jgi:iron complex outermembrane recepter protein
MSTNLSLRRAVRCALLTSAAAALAGVLPAQAQEDPTIQEVVVTGSRIPQPNLTSVSPVTADFGGRVAGSRGSHRDSRDSVTHLTSYSRA